jgi:transposase
MKHRPKKRGKINASVPKSLRTINPNCAGIDVGCTEIYVAVPADRDPEPVRVFQTFTRDLHTLAEWLVSCGITSVAMESTGVYWIPVYDVLEHYKIEVCLIDPRQRKTNKKSDVFDCQDIGQLHSYGLLSNSFRPPAEIRSIRTIVRHREGLIRDRATHIQRMQKALHQMNIQLDNVINDITGVTGMRILRDIVNGIHDPVVLSKHRDARCKCSEEDIIKSLEGTYLDEHLFELAQEVRLYDYYCSMILECEERLNQLYQAITAAQQDLDPLPPPKKGKSKRLEHPDYDVREQLYRLCGVDLTEIDGFQCSTAQAILSETGSDVSAWESSKQFASWLCVSPNNKITGGKVIGTQRKKTKNRATQALRMAAASLYRSNSALGAYFRRIQAKRGFQKAVKATAHKLARIVYAMLKTKTPYHDLGQNHYEQQYQNRVLRNLKRKAAKFNLKLVPLETQVTCDPQIAAL